MASLVKSAQGFSRLSRIYDRLAGLVYGKALRKAQTHFLPQVKTSSRALVLGGGTGWFLEALLETGRVEAVTYVELSEGMMEKSKARIQANLPTAYPKVVWVEGTIQEVEATPAFDLVCTHCFLDLFEGERLQSEVKAIQQRLQPGASWYFSDFKYAARWPMSWISRIMIWGMYRFFQWTCGIQAGRLAPFSEVLHGAGLRSQDRITTYGGMIEAVWYEEEV